MRNRTHKSTQSNREEQQQTIYTRIARARAFVCVLACVYVRACASMYQIKNKNIYISINAYFCETEILYIELHNFRMQIYKRNLYYLD